MWDEERIDISVIVTIFNIKEYIGECLESILNQEGVRIECICVDDASTDGSYEILMDYAKKDSRMIVVRNEYNKGRASARNVGFRHARGEYLYCVDGDDYLVSGALKRMHNCAKENNLDLLGFSAKSFFESEDLKQFGEENEYIRKKDYSVVKKGVVLFGELLENDDRVMANLVLYFYRRDYFEKNNLYMPEGLQYGDDSMFAMYMAAERAMCIPEQLYMRRYREGSACTSPLKKYYMESLIVLYLEELYIWKKYCFDNKFNEIIKNYFRRRKRTIDFFYAQLKNDDSPMMLLEQNPVANFFYESYIERRYSGQNIIPQNELDKIKEATRVILYGAGRIALEVVKCFEYNEIRNYEIVVSNKKNNLELLEGKQVSNIYDIVCEPSNTKVIVAMSKRNYSDVTNILVELGYSDIYWVEA